MVRNRAVTKKIDVEKGSMRGVWSDGYWAVLGLQDKSVDVFSCVRETETFFIVILLVIFVLQFKMYNVKSYFSMHALST